MSVTTTKPEQDRDQETFVETVLKMSGKSAEEARTTGALDRADDQVEKLFAPKYQTTGSPVHRAVWDAALPGDLFAAFGAQRLDRHFAAGQFVLAEDQRKAGAGAVRLLELGLHRAHALAAGGWRMHLHAHPVDRKSVV